MRIIYFVILLILLGCSSISKNNVLTKDYSKPRRIVVLIHGIGGNYKHFGHLRESLERHLSLLDKDISSEIVYFDYNTGNNELTTFDFSRHLVRFLNGYFLQTAPLKSSDKISFVMHSQGGLVGNIWLLNTIKGEKCYPQKYLRHLDSMITLSTPFWGANIASFAKKIYGYKYLPYGKLELEEMTFDSQTISDIRKSLIKYHDQIKKYPIRFLNIGAIRSGSSDNDILVAFPSSNQDFIYSDNVVGRKMKLNKSDFQQTSLSQFSLVKAIHLNPFALFFDMESLAGISQAFKSCIEDVKCNHPSFNKILNFIRGEKIISNNIGNKGNFFLDIEIETSPKVTRDKVEFYFDMPHPKLVRLKNDRPRDDYKIIPKGIHRFHFEGGILDSDYSYKLLKFRLKVPGHRSLHVEALLRPGVTTYIHSPLIAI